MITGELKSKIDQIWNDMYSYGMSNPLVVIEQLTYLFFIKSLDDMETENEKAAEVFGTAYERIFPADSAGQEMRWSVFQHKKAEDIHAILRDRVFPFIKQLRGDTSSYARYMENAVFSLPDPLITEKVVTAITALPLSDRDLKGDLYEYMISKLQTAGRVGQFRTPRHIIRMMVRLMQPTLRDRIIDPACGTGGFLIGAGSFVREHYDRELRTDLRLRAHFQNEMFTGYDTDQTMLRITAMNSILHGMDGADIRFNDALSKNNTDADSKPAVQRLARRAERRGQSHGKGQDDEDRAALCRALFARPRCGRALCVYRSRWRALWRVARAQGSAQGARRPQPPTGGHLHALGCIQALRRCLHRDPHLYQDRDGRHGARLVL